MSRSTVDAPVATAFSPTPTAASARRRLISIVAVCLSGVLITAGFSYQVLHKPGVYLAQVNVLFLPPKSGFQPNALLSNSESLVSVAGAVGKMVDPDPTANHIVSPTVNLANEGVRTGYSVSLPNYGGQFANNFARALLNVQVVAPTATQAVGIAQRLVDEINSKLGDLAGRQPGAPSRPDPDQPEPGQDPGVPPHRQSGAGGPRDARAGPRAHRRRDDRAAAPVGALAAVLAPPAGVVAEFWVSQTRALH